MVHSSVGAGLFAGLMVILSVIAFNVAGAALMDGAIGAFLICNVIGLALLAFFTLTVVIIAE